jgi:glucosamine-6-phosphate deaminase
VQLRIFETAAAAAHALADRVVDRLGMAPHSVFGLPTGRTPVDAYARLRQLHAAGHADFANATTFNLDEFVGLAPKHPGSFHSYMEVHLFRGINIDPARVHFLHGAASNLDVECDRYEAAIETAGGIDLQILGLGTNGHIGFNEPADHLAARTHRVTLHESTRFDNAALFGGDVAQVPREALSMGMATILNARSIVLVATGQRKAPAVERMLHGPLTTHMPASLLQTHRDVAIYLDAAAASRLR